MIYLYGLAAVDCDGLTNALGPTDGLQGPLQYAQIGPWCLVFSDHDDAEILPKRRLLLTHARVLEKILPFCTILPARFGLVAANLAEVGQLVHDRESEIAAQFHRVKDAVELGVRVLFPRQEALSATLAGDKALLAEQNRLRKSGPEAHFAIATFGGKLADVLDRRRGEAQRQLLEALRPLARDHVLRRPETDTEVLRAEFLVCAKEQAAFEAEIAAVTSSLDFAPGSEPVIEIIGPVPMYHFVRLNLAFEHDEEAA